MRIAKSSLSLALLLLPLTYALVVPPPPAPASPHLLRKQGEDWSSVAVQRIPTVHESAVQARRILQLERIGTLSTVFPSDGSNNTEEGKDDIAGSRGENEGSGDMIAAENRPPGLGGMPIGLMEYFGACEEEQHPGDPTMLAITIATSFKNARAGSNVTLSLQWHAPSYYHSQTALPRFALVGYIEQLSPADVRAQRVGHCFARKHPDARLWFPGNEIHESIWARLVVQHVYWIGGFGDRAYIGWIPLADWKAVTQREIDSIRLPGEEDHDDEEEEKEEEQLVSLLQPLTW